MEQPAKKYRFELDMEESENGQLDAPPVAPAEGAVCTMDGRVYLVTGTYKGKVYLSFENPEKCLVVSDEIFNEMRFRSVSKQERAVALFSIIQESASSGDMDLRLAMNDMAKLLEENYPGHAAIPKFREMAQEQDDDVLAAKILGFKFRYY